MAKHYCSVHGEYSGDYGCPDCQRAEERAEEASIRSAEAHDELLERLGEISEQNADAAERAAYLTNNPGDYDCPACRMKSLKYLASRCPRCQSDIPDAFWERVQERERLEAEKRKQAEIARQKWLASPEYAAQQEKARQEAEDRRKQTEALEREKKGRSNALAALGCLFIPCVGPIISIVLAHTALRNLKGTGARGHRILAICLLVLTYGAIGTTLIVSTVNARRDAIRKERESATRAHLQSQYSKFILGVWKDQDGDMYEYKADGTKIERLQDGRESSESWSVRGDTLDCGSWHAKIVMLNDSRYEIQLPGGRMWSATRVPQSVIDADRAKAEATRKLVVGTWRNEDGTRTFTDGGRVIGSEHGDIGTWSLKGDIFNFNGNEWKLIEVDETSILMKGAGIFVSDFRATRVK